MSLQESKEYQQGIEIHKHKRLQGAELDGEIAGQCRAAAINKVNGWNDGPSGKQYEFKDITIVKNENVDTDTDNDFIHGTDWKYTSLATYKVFYEDLQH
ncbi:hypothetical protein [Bacillus pumilus]|uniref:hypothetical protein n=1 Tax=Bacillus pumilus TaxID=1408 RepID=UPI0015D56261|nr:hypothetical protein [Bacillus pumilus]QLI78747.1 hypothetical protein HZ310_13350 [Bacillus pumilus]